MIKIVLDTNILISAALTETGNSSKIVNMVLNGDLAVYFSNDISIYTCLMKVIVFSTMQQNLLVQY